MKVFRAIGAGLLFIGITSAVGVFGVLTWAIFLAVPATIIWLAFF